MILESTIILFTLFLLVVFGGLINISFMEVDAKKYWRNENKKQQTKSQKFGSKNSASSGFANFKSRLVTRNPPKLSRFI